MHLLRPSGIAATALFLAFGAGAGASPVAAPSSEPPRPTTPFQAAAAVAPQTLDGLRGGFVGSDGLAVSFSLERAVSVDGNLVAHAELQLGDLGRLVAGNAPAPVPVSVPDSIFIQNSLNDRAIDHATVINASVDAHGMLQTMHFQSTLANALNLAVTNQH